jgi:putative oxidoreductase
MFGGVGGQAVPLGSIFGAAGVIELVCSVLIMLGLFTRIAAFIASGEMAAAYFIAHFPMGLVPLQNGGELAVLYCFAFLYIATRGPGMCSLDGLRR